VARAGDNDGALRFSGALGCGREPVCADEDLPWLDADGDELFGGYPGIVGEAAVDLGFTFCVDDQQNADAPLLAAGERPAESHASQFDSRPSGPCPFRSRL
jgi:hypothetical protein